MQTKPKFGRKSFMYSARSYQSVHTNEVVCGDYNKIMSLSLWGCPRVPSMQHALVNDLECSRCECDTQRSLHSFGTLAHEIPSFIPAQPSHINVR